MTIIYWSNPMSNPYVPTIVIASTEIDRWKRMVWHIQKAHERGDDIHVYTYTSGVKKRVLAYLCEQHPSIPDGNINWWVLADDDKFPKQIASHPDTADTNMVHFMFGLCPSNVVVNRLLENMVTVYEQVYVDVSINHLTVEGMFNEFAINFGVNPNQLAAG